MPQQASQYDKIFRENLEVVIPMLISRLLGIQAIASEELPDEVQHTKERKPDALKKITDNAGQTFILHIEFQLADEPDMVFRMAEYYIMLRRQYKLPVRQYVFFLGKAIPKMPVVLQEQSMYYRFPLLPFSAIDYTIFVHAQKPEEIILAILANFNDASSSQVIEEILSGLDKHAGSPLNYQRYTNQLRILAQMRKLATQIDFIMDSFLPIYDEKEDIFLIAAQFRVIERIALRLLKETDFSDEKIADITGTTVEIISKVKTKHGLH